MNNNSMTRVILFIVIYLRASLFISLRKFPKYSEIFCFAIDVSLRRNPAIAFGEFCRRELSIKYSIPSSGLLKSKIK